MVKLLRTESTIFDILVFRFAYCTFACVVCCVLCAVYCALCWCLRYNESTGTAVNIMPDAVIFNFLIF